jgi:phenylalanyl-tRNA synthetase beta chain
MRVPMEWLCEYCELHMDAHTLAQRLALTGTEVERVERHGVSELEHFVVGHVLERRKHPDADRLSVCMVDTGGSTPAQIVCGAPNVAAGQTVGVARPGAVMPDGTRLQRARLRGVESQGMILSERELQISDEHTGIMVLDQAHAPGTPLAEVAPIATDVLVLEVTPNRPDCLSIYGVAREAAAATGAQLRPAPWEYDPGSFGALDGIAIINQAGDELCPRFTARIFDGVRVGPSPLWLKARLMACGQRPISNVVDITNYVMLLTGQPMHAFDRERIVGGRLTVRLARDGERMQTLDGQQRTLGERVVVIEDGDGPTSIAGVMGGGRSEVTEQSTSILSEAATWNGPNIHATSQALGLRSEASSRFEKGLAVEQTLWAQAVATRLFADLCGASVRPGTLDIGAPPRPPLTIHLREARIERLLGMSVPRARCRELLRAIGFATADAGDGLDVTVPDFRRADVTREADLIEEVARLAGLETLPATLPARRTAVGRLTASQRLRRRLEDALAAHGLHEVVGWSFSAPEVSARLLLDAEQAVELANPMSSEQAQMRTGLIGSLLEVAARNQARGASRLALFESGAVYLPDASGASGVAREPHHLAALISGAVRAPTWREQHPPQADFFTAKGLLGAVLGSAGIPWQLAEGAGQPFLHPGRGASVQVGGAGVGWVGEIHPRVTEGWGLSEPVAGFEIDLSAIEPPAPQAFVDLTSFPPVHEDLAIVVAEHVPAGELLEVIASAGRPLLQSGEVFDVFHDERRLGAGLKSVAVRLSFGAADRTLTDEEVARQRQLIIAALDGQLGGRIRDAQ